MDDEFPDLTGLKRDLLIRALIVLVEDGLVTAGEIRRAARREARAERIEQELAGLPGLAESDDVPRDARGHRLTAKNVAAKKVQGMYLSGLAKLHRRGLLDEVARVREVARTGSVREAAILAYRLVEGQRS